MDVGKAARDARRLLDTTIPPEDRQEVDLDRQRVLERAWCYVFYWNSVDYLRTGDDAAALFGNAPIVVPKDGGGAFMLGTHMPIEELLDEYEETHGIAHGDQRELTRHGGDSEGVGSQQRAQREENHDDQRRLDDPDG